MDSIIKYGLTYYYSLKVKYIKSPCLGKASCTDILEQGMAVDVNSQLFIIEKDKDVRTIGTDLCVYMPEENINKYGVGSKIDLKIDNEVYSFEVTALTYMPNGQGECAMKCHSSTLLPWNILFGANQNVELLVENKTIFETFFKNKFFN